MARADIAPSRFQSAPLTKARGDACIRRAICNGLMFQSAPLTKARGDKKLLCLLLLYISFNPLPSQKQGETGSRLRTGRRSDVSIRSPHKSKGRRSTSSSKVKAKKFQSAPLTKARGDIGWSGDCDGLMGFNPLPSQKQGETAKPWQRRRVRSVSIRSPHKSKGRQSPGFAWVVGIGVSIRSPHKSKGRRYTYGSESDRKKFQSAPLTKARGDATRRGM